MKQSGFVFDGNHFIADFVNTRKNKKGVRIELLHGFDDLINWLEQAGKREVVIGSVNSLSLLEQEEAFTRVLNFRNRLEQAFFRIDETNAIPTDFIESLNGELAESGGGYYRLESGESGIAVVRRYEISRLFALFLEEAATFLATIKPGNLKKCENGECILYFYDTSRNQQRRWCSMERCGNRVKANQHYRRKKLSGNSEMGG